MAPHHRVSVENIPLEHHDNGLRPVIRDHDAGNSGEVQRQERIPAVEISEQPFEESRFRYSRESQTNGSLGGVHSTESVKTYPTIRVNYDGPVKIRVSCVNKNPPYKPHPHKIVGRRENCSEGVYTRIETITEQNRDVQLKNIGIQCTKREHIARALQDRARLEVDPFGTGYDDPSSYTSIMLHYVRLAIEVFIPDAAGELTTLLAAVHTDVITDLPTKMLIFRATPQHGSAHGGTQITMLTTKLPCNEIMVRFQDEAAGWQADVRPVRIHHLVGVVVDTPPYCNPDTNTLAHVTIRLVRPTTGDPDVDKHKVGEPYKYIYKPGPDLDLTCLQDVIEPKRQRTEDKVLIHPLQHDLDYPPTGNAPPEPQPSTSTESLEINTFSELDKWFYEYMHTQPSQLTPGMQNSLNGTMSPQPFIELPPNPSQGYSQTDYPRRQQFQESLERNSQPVQNHRPTGSQPSSIGRHQAVQTSETGQQFASHSQTRVLPSQHTLQEPNNVINDLLSLLPQQVLIPQSSQSNLRTPNTIAQKESSLKRTHSQMDNINPRGSHSTVRHSTTEIPLVRTQYSQTEPRQPERPNIQNAQYSSRASNATHGEVYHSTGQRVGGQFETRRFTEFLPNQFDVFQIRSNHLLIPEIVQTTQPQPQYPLIDLTEPEFVSERTLNCEELRFFEDGSQEYQGNQQLITEVNRSNVTSQVEYSSEDTEILSLSDELVKLLNF